MPIHDLGFRGWDGEPTSNRTRWWVIAVTGIRVVWRSFWLRRMVMASWMPALLFALAFLAYEQALPHIQKEDAKESWPQYRKRVEAQRNSAFRQLMPNTGMVGVFANVLPGVEGIYLQYKLERQPDDRHFFWSYLLNTFFRYPQSILMVLLVGMIAPPLISSDVRSKAFLLYFSRPISLVEYVIGKMFLVCFFLAAMSTLPALCLYFLGVLLSPDLSVIFDTWDLPFRIFLASFVLLIPTTSLALMLSSLTAESRFASFAWFAVWALGGITYAIIRATELPGAWGGVFLFEAIGDVQTWIFLPDLPPDIARPHEILAAATILISITVFSLIVLMRRVSAPIRV